MKVKKDAADGFSSTPAARNHKNYYRSTRSRVQGSFDRTKLPYPINVLCMLGITPGKPNQAGYWKLYCPFHKNGAEKHPSLNLHQVNGNFRCHACYAKGGDILDFYRMFTGLGFVEAAKRLDCWGHTR
jgi:hypothetical protein